jgi:hypothetical protein
MRTIGILSKLNSHRIIITIIITFESNCYIVFCIYCFYFLSRFIGKRPPAFLMQHTDDDDNEFLSSFSCC